jgi:hypothetical protein
MSCLSSTAQGNHGPVSPSKLLGADLVALGREIDVPRATRFAFPAAPLLLESSLPAEQSGRAWWHIDMLELQRAVLLRDHTTLIERTLGRLVARYNLITAAPDSREARRSSSASGSSESV